MQIKISFTVFGLVIWLWKIFGRKVLEIFLRSLYHGLYSLESP